MTKIMRLKGINPTGFFLTLGIMAIIISIIDGNPFAGPLVFVFVWMIYLAWTFDFKGNVDSVE